MCRPVKHSSSQLQYSIHQCMASGPAYSECVTMVGVASTSGPLCSEAVVYSDTSSVASISA